MEFEGGKIRGMELPSDLKHYRAPDAFQLFEASVAYDIFWIGLIVMACIL